MSQNQRKEKKPKKDETPQQKNHPINDCLVLQRKFKCWIEILHEQNWGMLRELSIIWCNVEDQTIIQLTRRRWPNLRFLSLLNNLFTGKGIRQLVINTPRNGGATNLRYLILSRNNIGNLGVQWLVKLNLPNLQEIVLRSCGIQAKGMKDLTKARWPGLQRLFLKNQNQHKNPNKIQSIFWEQAQEYDWKHLKGMEFERVQPIFWLRYVILSSIPANVVPIQHEYMQTMISKVRIVIKNRRLPKE